MGELRKRRYWTQAEIAHLVEHYPDAVNADLAAAMGRDARAIYNKAHELGLRKSAAWQAAEKERRREDSRNNPAMRATQFKRGLVPWNKGKPFEAGGRSAETRFKPGQMAGAAAAKYKPVGTYRINQEGHLQVKVTDSHEVLPQRRWQAVHRLVWIAAHGPIPRGLVVRFRPGMFTNVLDEITIDRLQLITCAENMSRNSVHNQTPELARLSQLKGCINRQVNRIIRESKHDQPDTTPHQPPSRKPARHSERAARPRQPDGA